MKKIIYEKYEFESKDINYSTVENKITKHYKLGYAESSNFMDLYAESYDDLYIISTNGLIKFSMIIGKSKDGIYSISVTPNYIRKDMNLLFS